MGDVPAERTCRKCGQTKPLELFQKNSRVQTGRTNHCKACVAAIAMAWHEANRERHNASMRARDPEKDRAYWAMHPEQKKAKGIRYTRSHAEENRERAKAWYHANKERASEIARARYATHRAEVLEKWRLWREEHPEDAKARDRLNYERYTEKYHKYARQRQDALRANQELNGRHTEEEWQAKLVEFSGRCAHCGTTDRLSRDHIIPLSRGGNDLIDNIQPLCVPCNARKGTKIIP